MSSDWYEQWAVRHGDVFGLADEAGLRMVLAWAPLFAAAGYTAAELHAATDWLALHDPPRDRWAHLRAVETAVRHARALVYRREEERLREDRGECVACCGSGWVIVPHPCGVEAGEWRPVQVARGAPSFYTCAVLCHCPLGGWVGQHIRSGHDRRPHPPQRLADYERSNPRWRVQAAARAREQAERAALGQGRPAAAPANPDLDAAVAAAVARVQARRAASRN